MKGYTDNLTQLYNMLYLHENYQQYIKKNKDSIVVSIDFQKLKYINDNFGHEAGDKSIILFADIIRKVFKNSMLIRRSGDEFIIVTYGNQSSVVTKLHKVNEKITEAHAKGFVPIDFTFNSGIKVADMDLKESLYKADITMYCAKRNEQLIAFYKEELLIDIKNNENFINLVDKLIDAQSFNYQYQETYSLEGLSIGLYQLYIRDENNESLFDGNKLDVLKKNYRIKKIDLASIEYLFHKIIPNIDDSKQLIINVHHQTLLSREINFVKYIVDLAQKYQIDLKRVVFSINVNECNSVVKSLTHNLNELRRHGAKICINKLMFTDNNCLLSLLTMVDINYVNIERSSVIKAMNEARFKVVLEQLIKTFQTLNIEPVFINVEDQSELDFLNTISTNYLVRGYIYSPPINIKKMLN